MIKPSIYNARYYTRWLILLGLAMTLMSLLLEQLIVVHLDQQLVQQRGQVIEINYLIEQEWLNSQARTQRAQLSELVILLAETQRVNVGVKAYLQQLIEDLRFQVSDKDQPLVTLGQYNHVLKKALASYRAVSLEFINSRYVQRIKLEERIVDLQMSRARWEKIALLLQVLGLVLILSREIFRR
ncbi:hypothetical protein A0O36_02271 [Piscirickettsiaceae bacterium NZ-RLO1]|nr:hypothetical protein A0O36_02271 [Piscirickettsiaceae bacterium NZ-RLO1]